MKYLLSGGKGNKTNKKTNKKANKKEKKENKNFYKGYEIIDIELSKEENKGTLASSASIEYHYQNLDNIIEYFNILHKKKKLKSGYFSDKTKAGKGRTPLEERSKKGNTRMIKDFKDDINFFKGSVDNSLIQVDIPKKTKKPGEKVEGIYTTIDEFVTNLKAVNKKRFTPITINNLLPLPTGQIENHANMLLIDNKLKQIELFEPHGYKSEKSNGKLRKNAYNIKVEALKDFFMNYTDKIFSNYKFINSVDFVKKDAFQGLFDSNSGYCVTWSALYCHYRILNPNIPINVILNYIDENIVKGTILQYAKHIEDTLKNKI